MNKIKATPDKCLKGGKISLRGKSIIGWKRAEVVDRWGRQIGKAIVTLQIPSRARRVCPLGGKCRAERAIVLKIEKRNWSGRLLSEAETPAEDLRVISSFDHSFQYIAGKVVRPRSRFSQNLKEECRSGIHFFLTRGEAVNYNS